MDSLDLGLMGLGGALSLALSGLGFSYWRLRQQAQTTQAQLQTELTDLQQRSAQIQSDLEQQRQDLTEKLQTSQRLSGELENLVEALKQQCLRLRDQLETQAQQSVADTQQQAFEQVQTLLTQYPSVQKMAELKPDLPARNLVALLSGLENLLKFWGYTPIGNVWEQVTYDPQLHQGDGADLQPQEPVYVRFVGYRQGERILVPARVSRTLPARVSS
jgi:exonuclease VII large subunit